MAFIVSKIGELFSTRDDPQSVVCPKCDGLFTFCRSYAPHIDVCGFESYKLQCRECHIRIVGIIDPADNALLLSEIS
jgi:uncharacterized C2H2 Zn-finger protein